MYVMKSMYKKHIIKRNSKALCANEYNTLKSLDSPYTVNLKYSFMTKDSLVFIMDLCLGGDLRYWLEKNGKFEDERAKYYVCRTMMGLREIHQLNLVYRDLKPENILLDIDGRTRLSDMGLVTPIVEGMTGRSGTAGYIPPEALRGEVYDQTADWFALGCVAFEFLNGKSPYRSDAATKWLKDNPVDELESEAVESNDKKKKKNKTNVAVIRMPFEVLPWVTGVCTEAQGFVEELLVKDRETRLGKGGWEEIMNHSWLKDIHHGDLNDKNMIPFEPPPEGAHVPDEDDIGEFFDLGKEVKVAKDDFPEDKWTYVSPKAFGAEVVWYLKWKEAKEAAAAEHNPGERRRSSACALS